MNREFTADDGKQLIYRKFIAPSSGTVCFAKASNRSVMGSMNDHIHAAKFMLEDDKAPIDIGYRLMRRQCQHWSVLMVANTVIQ